MSADKAEPTASYNVPSLGLLLVVSSERLPLPLRLHSPLLPLSEELLLLPSEELSLLLSDELPLLLLLEEELLPLLDRLASSRYRKSCASLSIKALVSGDPWLLPEPLSAEELYTEHESVRWSTPQTR